MMRSACATGWTGAELAGGAVHGDDRAVDDVLVLHGADEAVGAGAEADGQLGRRAGADRFD